ncbi:MAG TPA: hypothetical protein VMC84_04360 [Methanocella sp.]|uniref:hypothetical protein n=1 Tax=Methanocella sp. TaxID=2052833 RepID=UPI002C7769E7|nr:hypothetical protein [Methanocella sp.]HTY90389.1 hypothetical protein [Methanocella sp.]
MAGAVEGTTGVSYTNVCVPTVNQVPIVEPSCVVPCFSFPACPAPQTNQILANTISLGGPAIQTSIKLYGPQTPSFESPDFVLPILCPPHISPFISYSPIFDP